MYYRIYSIDLPTLYFCSIFLVHDWANTDIGRSSGPSFNKPNINTHYNIIHCIGIMLKKNVCNYH